VSIAIFACRPKSPKNLPLNKSTQSDTIRKVPTSQIQQIQEDKRVYDSVIRKQFLRRNLSRQFDIHLRIVRFLEKDHIHDSCMVTASLIDKKSKIIMDSVFLTSNLFFTNYFDNSFHMISYSTNVGAFKEVADNYAGDLIIADLNFDGRDDIALINDMGGNGGSFYSYFIQQPDRKFILDRYLTDSMVYFPSDFNKKRKTLTTYVHSGVSWMGKHVYQFDATKREWKRIESIILGPKKTN